LKALQDRLSQLGKLDFGAFAPSEYFIYKSVLSKGGSIYTKLFRIEMGGAPKGL
jgi:hypothetical protein